MSATAGTVYSRRVIQLILQVQGIQQSAAQANRSLGSIEKSINSVKSALYAFGTFRAIDVFRDIADSALQMTNILTTLNKTSTETAYIQAQLGRVADTSRSPVDAVTKLFVRLDAAVGKYGKSTNDVLRVTQAVAQGLKLSGASAGETASAILQLSQAFASGRLQGDEFRAVLENAPALAQELTHQLFLMGKIGEDSLAALRKAASSGLLGTPELFEAFLRASSEIEVQFKKMTPTVSEFFTILRNHAIDTFLELNRRFQILRTVADAMQYLTEHTKELGEALYFLATTIIARYVIVSLLGVVQAVIGITAAIAGGTGLVAAFGTAFAGLPVLILAAAAAMLIFSQNSDTAAEAFDKTLKKFRGMDIEQLLGETERLRNEREKLITERSQLGPQDQPRPMTPDDYYGGAQPAISRAEALDKAIADTNSQLAAAQTALDNATDAAKKTAEAFNAADDSVDKFNSTLENLRNKLANANDELNALQHKDLKRYDELVSREKGYQEYLQTRKALEQSMKRPLTPQEDATLRGTIDHLQAVEDKVKTTHAALEKANREAAQAAETAARKNKEAIEAANKAAERQIENITAFDKQVQAIRDTKEETLAGVGMVGKDPRAIQDLLVARKNIRDFQILENSAVEKNIILTNEQIIEYKELIKTSNEALETARRVQAEFDTLTQAAESQDPQFALVRHIQELETALAEVGDRMSPDQLRAINNELADTREKLNGIGAAAERLKALDNPFAGLLTSVSQFHEGIRLSTEDTTKSFELIAQGSLGAIQFISEQMSALGIENFEFQKAMAMAQATINAAVAITEVFKYLGPTPPAFAMAGLIAGLMGAQLAKIASEEPPARASGGAVGAGMPYMVGERGPEMYTDTGGRQIFIPQASGTISPGAGRGNVNIINTGQPVRVVSKTERDDGGIDIVVASVKAVEDTFDRSLRTGQGKFAQSMRTHTTAGKRF